MKNFTMRNRRCIICTHAIGTEEGFDMPAEIDEQTNIDIQSEDDASQEAAAASATTDATAEDTASLDAYRALAESQTQTIKELTNRLVSLQDQLAKAIGHGANFNDGKNEPLPDPEPKKDYTYLKDLDWSMDKHVS